MRRLECNLTRRWRPRGDEVVAVRKWLRSRPRSSSTCRITGGSPWIGRSPWIGPADSRCREEEASAAGRDRGVIAGPGAICFGCLYATKVQSGVNKNPCIQNGGTGLPCSGYGAATEGVSHGAGRRYPLGVSAGADAWSGGRAAPARHGRSTKTRAPWWARVDCRAATGAGAESEPGQVGAEASGAMKTTLYVATGEVRSEAAIGPAEAG